MKPFASLRVALRSSQWDDRLAAIEAVVMAGDVRFRSHLRRLARFHLAPPEVRAAADRAVKDLDRLRAERRGWLSLICRPELCGRVSMLGLGPVDRV